MAAVTLADIQFLSEQVSADGLVLSCYADMTVSEGSRLALHSALKARADIMHEALVADARAREELRENLAAIHDALESPELRAAHGLAVFSSTRRRFLRVIPLEVPVTTDLVLDRSPYLVPLLESMLSRKQYLVAHTDTNHGSIYAATPGEVRVLAEIGEDVPKKQHSGGGILGYGQANIARHREDRILHYRKGLLDELERHWDTGHFAGLILLGEHEVLEHVRKALPTRLSRHVVQESSESLHETPAEIERAIRTRVQAVSDQSDAEVAPEFWNRLNEKKSIATGAQAVIDAIQTGRVGSDGHGYLVFGPDPRETVGRCVACRTLTPEVLGPCPKCQAPCAPGNLWEELLLSALKNRIAVHFVRDATKLAPYEGVVAMLKK